LRYKTRVGSGCSSLEDCETASGTADDIDGETPTRVATVILSLNGADDTIPCVESVIISGTGNRTIVVDNGSRREDKARLEAALGGLVHLISLPDNVGVAAGWNIAIRSAFERYDPDFVFLLNNDTVLDKGVVRELVLFMDESPRTGAAGPSIMTYDDWSLHQYPRYRGVNQPIRDRKLSGCALLVRREVFDEIGMFDEEYFAYAEESDFLERMNQRGWSSYYIPTTARVYHKGAHTSSSISGFEAFHRTRNRLLFAGKNLSGVGQMVSVFSFFFKTLPLDLYHDLISSDKAARLGSRARGLIDGLRLFMMWRLRGRTKG
jgi:GT2 family glycosyltransferase